MKPYIALGATLLAGVILSACSNNTPPAYDNVQNIIVEGKSMTAEQYWKTYCEAKAPETLSHERCVAARNQATTANVFRSLGLDDKGNPIPPKAK